MHSGLGNDVGVQSVAKVDGVDVVAVNVNQSGPVMCDTNNVPFQIAVHNGEEDLEEQIDGIYENREEI